MNIYLLYTCDAWNSAGSRVLRGIFTDNTINLLDAAKKGLIENGVVDTADKIFIYKGSDGECEVDGCYLVN